MALVSGIGGGKGTPTKTALKPTGGNIYSLLNPKLAAQQNAQKAASQNAVKNLKPVAKKGATGAPAATKPPTSVKPPVNSVLPEQLPAFQEISAQEEPFTWTLEGDPTYRAALDAGESEFNLARANALADLQNQQTANASEEKALNKNATESRRRLAGNYASRGMAGGFAGAYSVAEAEANARQIAAQTSLKDQITALNAQYLSNYGAAGTDWTGTLTGQKYKTAAAQAAITNQLAQRGVA
jgi:hypothetical protein